jgi:hypothetical protein
MAAMEKEEKLNVFMVPSNCCLASFANTAAKSECNATIRSLVPRGWSGSKGFESLDEWLGVIKKPILALELTK